MTTNTQEAPTEAPKYVLAAPRKAPRKGIPKEGLLLFTGLPKSGKNTLLLSIPGLCLIETELQGSEHLDGWVQEVGDLDSFRSAFRAAMDEPSCKAIGVSTLDKLIGWWQAEICEIHQVGSMSAQIEGVNLWNELRKRVETFIDVSKKCGKLVVVAAHYKEPKLDKEGRLVITHNVDAPGKLGGLICSEADLIGACSKAKVGAKMQFKVSFVGGGEVGAYGGRVKELEGKEILLPEDGQWAAIVAAAEGESKKAAPAKTEPAVKTAAKGGK